MKKITILLTILFFTTSLSFSQGDGNTEKIKWYSFEKAMKLNKKNPKKFFIDMYTDWCGWCKKMDQTTFKDPVIAKYMNENYYPVKFDAERTDTVMFQNRMYVNPNPTGRRSSHELARALLNGRMSYPSFVFLNEEGQPITIVPGYQKAAGFEPILHFIAEEAYKNQSWEQYQQSFKGSIKSE
jgi:thioredoxin-related protein